MRWFRAGETWVAVATVLLLGLVAAEHYSVEEQVVEAIGLIVSVYIAGQSAVRAVAVWRGDGRLSDRARESDLEITHSYR